MLELVIGHLIWTWARRGLASERPHAWLPQILHM